MKYERSENGDGEDGSEISGGWERVEITPIIIEQNKKMPDGIT